MVAFIGVNHVQHQALGKKIALSGWVHRRRDHGGVIFIDLREKQGLCQLVFHPDQQEMFRRAEKLRNEYVISVTGVVTERPEGTINPDMKTGSYEVMVESLEVLNTCLPLPFGVADSEDSHLSEEVRLRYRYLDIRRDMQSTLKSRAHILRLLRGSLESTDFMEVETPVLTKPTPEGAREYLVPSRVQKHHAFALQQSPQQYKQMLMVAGVDKYYQVVKCFRDEDLRADRQPEFTQLDMEMAFATKEDVMQTMELAVLNVFDGLLGLKLGPIARYTYHEVMQKYGTDKPDLRNPLYFVDVTKDMQMSGFSVFETVAKQEEHRIVVMKVPNGSALTRKQLDDYTKLLQSQGAKGLAYMKVEVLEKGVDGLKSPLLKFLKPEAVHTLLQVTEVKNGDMLFFGAGSDDVVNHTMGLLREKVARDMDLIKDSWELLWVVDFPMFEPDTGCLRADTNATWHAMHHPFTKPSLSQGETLENAYRHCLSHAYDLVLNGCEIGGGSERIHDYALQLEVLEVLGFDEVQSKQKLGHLLQALQFGAPPHAGFALGIDRFCMLLLQKNSIRDVIAFPKTQTAACLLTDAPSALQDSDISELALKLTALDLE